MLFAWAQDEEEGAMEANDFIKSISFKGHGNVTLVGYPIAFNQDEFIWGETHKYYGAGGGGIMNIEYSAPHYKSEHNEEPSRDYPIAYTVGSDKIILDAEIKINDDIDNCDIRLTAHEKVVEINAVVNEKTIELKDIEIPYKIQNNIGIIPDFTIKWEVKTNEDTWKSIGETTHKLYAVFQEGGLGSFSSQFYIDFVNEQIGNKSVSSKDHLINELWGVFENLSVISSLRKQGTVLSYYKDIQNSATEPFNLLFSGNGQCTSFQRLFAELLKSQGISAELVEITPVYSDHLMLVKNWHFDLSTQMHLYKSIEYTHRNIGTSDNTEDLFLPDNTGSYSRIWELAEVTDQPGISGQSNPNPISHFRNHRIVKVNGIYYDPSYGETYINLQKMQEKAIDGLIIKNHESYGLTDDGIEIYEYYILKSNEKLLIK
jgi:hypothetical protein